MLLGMLSVTMAQQPTTHPQKQQVRRDIERDTLMLQQVVVTGTRTPKALANTPIPTRLITRQDIARTDATDIQDLLQQEMPGVEFSYAMNQQTHLNFAGFGGQSVLFLVDGERLAGETMDDVDFSRLLTADVERIEIVRGAASALYGSSAGGGVINIITRESRQPWSLHLDSRWSRHSGQRYGLQFGLHQGRWTNMLSATYHRENTYGVNSNAFPQTRVYTEVYGHQMVNVKDRLTYRPCDQLTLTGRLGYYFRQVPRSVMEPERYRDFTAGLKAQWTISTNDQLEFSYAFDQYDKSIKQKALDLDVRSYSNVQNSLRTLYSHSFKEGSVLTAGADVMRDYLYNIRLTDPRQSQYSADAFAQYDWQLNEQWEVVGALRYDYFSEGRLSRLTPKLSVRWQPQRYLNVRLGYGMGFRAPTLKERYSQFDMSGIWVIEGNESLRSETSHNFNASVDYTKGRYSVMAMTFYNNVRNKIATGLPYYHADNSRQLYLPYTNLAHYTICGGELSARARWGAFSVKAGYAYTHEAQPKDEDGNSINNQYIPARPHSLTWEGCVDKDFTADYGLHVTLSGRWLSGVDSQEYRNYYDISQGTSTIRYPAYMLWKLSVMQQLWQRVKVTVAFDNLFNYRPDYYYLNAPVTDGTNLMLGVSIDLY